MPIIALDAQTHIPYTLRYSIRAKRLQMRAIGGTIEVIVPKSGVQAQSLTDFLTENAKWLTKQWKKAQANPYRWPNKWLQGDALWLCGEEISLNLCFVSKKATRVRYDKGIGIVVDLSSPKCGPAQIAAAVTRWYRQAARAQVLALVERYTESLGRAPTGVSIRQQRHRWGSCGSQGRININWVLLLAPPAVLEYVVVHELCHLYHRHHGKSFWLKVQELFPDYATQEAWLRESGSFLIPPPSQKILEMDHHAG